MRLTVKSEYACLAIICLARNFGKKRLLSIRLIADNEGIPKKFLEQILLTLKRSGYVRSYSGSKGGYVLRRKPATITLAEIIRLFDGPLAPVESASRYFYRHTPSERNKNLLKVFKDVRDIIAKKLEHVTFDDLAEKQHA
jgi:Rrf2 family transcriptional regulator, cysteine metabolism repressor